MNVGTSSQKESYMAGSTMTNVTLSILNLQRKETITIDVVSNQDFTKVWVWFFVLIFIKYYNSYMVTKLDSFENYFYV